MESEQRIVEPEHYSRSESRGSGGKTVRESGSREYTSTRTTRQTVRLSKLPYHCINFAVFIEISQGY